jgi:hypothetical protein
MSSCEAVKQGMYVVYNVSLFSVYVSNYLMYLFYVSTHIVYICTMMHSLGGAGYVHTVYHCTYICCSIMYRYILYTNIYVYIYYIICTMYMHIQYLTVMMR